MAGSYSKAPHGATAAGGCLSAFGNPKVSDETGSLKGATLAWTG